MVFLRRKATSHPDRSKRSVTIWIGHREFGVGHLLTQAGSPGMRAGAPLRLTRYQLTEHHILTNEEKRSMAQPFRPNDKDA
jgi:hypothetical protein